MNGARSKRLRKLLPFKSSRRRIRRGRLASVTSGQGHGERTVKHITSTNKYAGRAKDAS